MAARQQALQSELASAALRLLDEHFGGPGRNKPAHPGAGWKCLDEMQPHDDPSNWQLLKAMLPFEARPKVWLRVLCPCGRLVTNATYDGGGIFAGHETRKRVTGAGTLIQPAPGPTANVRLAHLPRPAGFENEPAGAHVWARRAFSCPRQGCPRRFVYEPIGIVRAWLRAVEEDTDVLLLGHF